LRELSPAHRCKYNTVCVLTRVRRRGFACSGFVSLWPVSQLLIHAVSAPSWCIASRLQANSRLMTPTLRMPGVITLHPLTLLIAVLFL
jgi:hypothetical protein